MTDTSFNVCVCGSPVMIPEGYVPNPEWIDAYCENCGRKGKDELTGKKDDSKT